MSENNDIIKSLENILQEVENPVSTKKQKVDVILAVKALILEVTFLRLYLAQCYWYSLTV